MERRSALLCLLVILSLHLQICVGLVGLGRAGFCVPSGTERVRGQGSLPASSRRSISEERGGLTEFLNSQGFTYGVGSMGLITVLANRLSILDESVSDFQSRLDLISVMACSALLLNALTTQEIETRERDTVTLVGYSCTSVIVSPRVAKSTLGGASAWLCDTIMTGVPGITSVHIIDSSHMIMARIGVVGDGDDKNEGKITPGKILSKVLLEKEEQYLPDVQILPGKVVSALHRYNPIHFPV